MAPVREDRCRRELVVGDRRSRRLSRAWDRPGYCVGVARQPMTADEVLSFHTRLSNWGRWGSDDQLGTLNFVTEEVTAAAASVVRLGQTVSCARPPSTPTRPD